MCICCFILLAVIIIGAIVWYKSSLKNEWRNFHRNVIIHIKQLITPYNSLHVGGMNKYNKMTLDIQGIIKKTIDERTTIRAFGAAWSWTMVNATQDGVMIDTSKMGIIMDMTKDMVSDEYPAEKKKNLVFTQCGVKVRSLNTYLKNTGRSLKTSGASDAQTIVGAMSTGTHGSNLSFGAIQDFIVGLHVVTGPNPDDHVWIEKESPKIASNSFLQSINIKPNQIIRDDKVFNSTIVCFGSFGFIHSVLLETDDNYQMKLIWEKVPYDNKLVTLMNTIDYKHYGLKYYNNEDLCHLQVVINPYDFDPVYKTGNAILIYGYKPEEEFLTTGILDGIANDIVWILRNIDDCDPSAIPKMVTDVLALQYLGEYKIQQGTLGQLFTGDGPPFALAGSSMCVDILDIEKVLVILHKHTPKNAPEFAGVFSLRFVKSSAATFSCTRYGEVTCVIEADGILNKRTEDYYSAVWKNLIDDGIKYTFHWGKLNNMDRNFINNMYGNSVKIWKASRDRVLTNPDVKKIFINDILQSWGLD